MTSIFISGVTGRVGRILLSKIIQDPKFSLAGGSASIENKQIGVDLGVLNGTAPQNILITSGIESTNGIDCIVDFSQPCSSMNILRIASQNSTPLLIGTTGFDEIQIEEISELSSKLPLLLASNTSLGITIIKKIIEGFGTELSLFSTPSVQETHHIDKRDSPSGTALDIAAKLTSTGLYDQDIKISSERVSDHAGEHKIIFKRDNETIEITHNALDRSIFAEGALVGIDWLKDKDSGLYSMNDIYSS